MEFFVPYAKYRESPRPCIIYEIIDQGEEFWDIAVLGNVPTSLLEEVEPTDEDLDAIDLAMELSKDEYQLESANTGQSSP